MHVIVVDRRTFYERGLPYMTSAQKEGGQECSKFANNQYRLCGQIGGSTNQKMMWTSYMEAPKETIASAAA